MSASKDAALMGLLDGETGLCKRMSAVDASEGIVVGTLHTIFHNEEGATVQVFQIVEEFIGYAVRSCADDDAHDIFDAEGLFVELAEMRDGGIGVGIGLEIGEILHLRIFPRKELLACFQLLGDAVLSLTIGGVESTVVAVDAAPRRESSVAIGTGETRIDGNLLHTEGETVAYPRPVIIIIRCIHFI